MVFSFFFLSVVYSWFWKSSKFKILAFGGQCDGTVHKTVKTVSFQAGWPEFTPWDLCGGRRELTPVLVICSDDISSARELQFILYTIQIQLIGISSGLILSYSGLFVHPDLRSRSYYITLTCCVSPADTPFLSQSLLLMIALECNTNGLGSAPFVPFPHHGTSAESTALTRLSFCHVECVGDCSVIELNLGGLRVWCFHYSKWNKVRKSRLKSLFLSSKGRCCERCVESTAGPWPCELPGTVCEEQVLQSKGNSSRQLLC